MIIINIADLQDPSDPKGRTYRQVNAAKQHRRKLGELVEFVPEGLRLWVAFLGRDCDQSPSYWLTCEEDAIGVPASERAPGSWSGGYPEWAIRKVRRTRKAT